MISVIGCGQFIVTCLCLWMTSAAATCNESTSLQREQSDMFFSLIPGFRPVKWPKVASSRSRPSVRTLWVQRRRHFWRPAAAAAGRRARSAAHLSPVARYPWSPRVPQTSRSASRGQRARDPARPPRARGLKRRPCFLNGLKGTSGRIDSSSGCVLFYAIDW